MKRKTQFWICTLAILGVITMLSSSCKKSSDNNNNNPPTTNVTDKDGNVYTTVTIGTQVWMVENLKTTKYSDGTSIPLVTDYTAWINLSTPGYCWFNNDAGTYKNTYGALYNWYTINTGNLAPTGWHVPNLADWSTLITFLGGDQVAGGKIKTGTGWNSGSGSNSSGFTAYPAGSRTPFSGSPGFGSMGSDAYFWLPTERDSETAYMIQLVGGYDKIYTDSWDPKGCGFSVRCVKN